jgi:hypothetical protein
MALILLAGLYIGACSQENALGQATAQLFHDPHEGPWASLRKSSAYLQKAGAVAEKTPEKGAPDAFAAWWYNFAAQYWSEIEAKKPGGERFDTAIERIIRARRDLERALGWDTEEGNRLQQEAYNIMQAYK